MAQRKKPIPHTLFKPVWRLPFILDKYRGGGKRSKLVGPIEPWLEAAIESGLVEMVPHEPGQPFTCGWLEQIDKSIKIPYVTEEEMNAMLAKGIADALSKDKK